jgi:hypothetical protein
MDNIEIIRQRELDSEIDSDIFNDSKPVIELSQETHRILNAGWKQLQKNAKVIMKQKRMMERLKTLTCTLR